MENILLPELGEGIEKATIACWHASVGDQVAKDDDLVEVVTDKATFNVPAPASGEIKEIHVSENQEADIGCILAVIDTLGK